MIKLTKIASAAALMLVAVALSASISSASSVGPVPGVVLWTYYLASTPADPEPFVACGPGFNGVDVCNEGSNGDNILRLINPNGSANTNLAGGGSHLVCAMIYVFDDDEEMGECCGCPITSAGIATFSVQNNLTANWAASGSEGQDNASGPIAIVATAQNNFSTASPSNGKFCPFGSSPACNFGCDPTNIPGFQLSAASNLLGSMTHNTLVDPPIAAVAGITETALFDDGPGEATNVTYLRNACGALVGNSSGGGVCTCPPE